MGLIIVQGRAPTVIGSIPGRGPVGIGVASVVINDDKHLIVTLTNGDSHDAGVLPSGDEVDALTAQLTALSERVEALERGAPIPNPEPGVPENALTGPGGRLLVSASGKYLVFSVNTRTAPANALTHEGGALLTNNAGQILTSGDTA